MSTPSYYGHSRIQEVNGILLEPLISHVEFSNWHIDRTSNTYIEPHMDRSLHQRDNTRTRLFDSDFNQPLSPYAQPKKKTDYSQSSLAQLESQSEQDVSTMSQKIQALKHLSTRMGEEIRGSNHTLDQLSDTFENTAMKLRSTFKNMLVMAQKSKISIKTWLLIFFIVGVFFFWAKRG